MYGGIVPLYLPWSKQNETFMWTVFFQSQLYRAFYWLKSNGPILLIIIVGLFPITWFKEGLPFAYYDGEVPLPPFYAIERYWHIWDAFSPPGTSNPRKLAALFFALYFYFLNQLGVPLFVSQALFIVSLNIIAGLSIYALFVKQASTSPKRKLGGFFAAFFYMNNMFLVQIVWAFGVLVVYTFYTLMPLLFFLYVKGMHSSKPLKYAGLLVLVSIGIASCAIDLPYIFPLLITVFFFLLYFTVINISRSTIIRVINFNIAIVGLALLVHAWWWIPLVGDFQRAYNFMAANRTFVQSDNLTVLLNNSSTSSLLHLFQTLGSVSLYHQFPTTFGIETWVPYAPVFVTRTFGFLSFLIPITAFIGIISFKEVRSWYFTGLFILMLFLAKGAHQPMGSFFIWLVRDVPGGVALRAPFNKLGLGLAFAYAFVFGFGVIGLQNFILRRFPKKISHPIAKLTIAVIATILVVYGYLYWNGDVISGPTLLKGGARFKIPSYYQTVDQWLRQDNNFRILTLPLTRLAYGAYDWEQGYWGIEPSMWLFSVPTIARVTDATSYAIPLYIAEYLSNDLRDNPTVGCLVGLLNVHYILLHEDASWRFVNRDWWVRNTNADSDHYHFLLNSLNNQSWLHRIVTFDQLHFYENSSFMPHTYIGSNLIYVSGGFPEMIKTLYTCDPQSPPVIFLSTLQPAMDERVKQIAADPPSTIQGSHVKLVRINSSNYRVSIHSETQHVILVFGESYHPAWSAFIAGEQIETHLMVNGYANAWVIPEKGDFVVDIQFGLQKYVFIGGLLSILGVLTCNVLILMSRK